MAGFTAGNYPDVAYEYGSSAAQLARQPKLVDLTDKVKDAGLQLGRLLPLRAAGGHGQRQGRRRPGPGRQPRPRLQQEAVRRPPAYPCPTATGPGRTSATRPRSSPTRATKTYGWAYVNDGSEDTVWRYLALLWQAGGDLLNADNTKPAFDSPAGLAALQQLQDMAVTDKSVYLDTGNGNYLNLFNSGKIAMLWTGPWDLSSINSDVDYGVTLLPGYNGNHETISGPDLYMLFDHSDGRGRDGADFMTWLTSATGAPAVRHRHRRPPAAQVGDRAARSTRPS